MVNAAMKLKDTCFLKKSYDQPAAAAAAAAKSLQSCPTLCDPHRRQPTTLPHPWDSPGKNTGVGCHFLLQCVKVKSESEWAVVASKHLICLLLQMHRAPEPLAQMWIM